GVFLFGLYEIQVLDSCNNLSYDDGQASAIYGQSPPLVNASRPPGEWQTYDVVYTGPRFEDRRLKTPSYVTVFHNGIVTQNQTAILRTPDLGESMMTPIGKRASGRCRVKALPWR